jgi:hypothetical protein
MLLSIAVALLVVSCGAGGGPDATPSATTAAVTWTPHLVLTGDSIRQIRARIAAGDEPWASAWTAFVKDYAGPALGEAPQVVRGPYTGGVEVHQAFLQLDDDSRAARNLAIAYAVGGDIAYARAAHDILVAWSREARPTTLADYDSPDTGQLQSWGAFSFAYAYDLTRASGLYSPAEAAAVSDYFRRFTAALRGAADRLAADPSIGTQLRRPYEWSNKLTYRYEDRVIGGTFAMALDLALLGLASQTEDGQTIAWVLDANGNPLRADRAVQHALRPENDGDGQGTRPVPEVAILRTYRPARGGTVDYMTYSARLATLLCQVSDNLGRPLSEPLRPALRASWTYLARFFAPGAAASPNPTDVIDIAVCVPRFTLGYRILGTERLRAVLDEGDRSTYYEPQFLGPVTLTHWPLR